MFRLEVFQISLVEQLLAMAGTRAVKVELSSMSLKFVNPVVLRDKKKNDELLEDLIRMGCGGLLVEPWTLKSKAMAQEFLQTRSNQ